MALRLGLVECLVPGERVKLAASGSVGMWFEASWTVDHIDSGIAQDREAPLEGRVRGERTVDEREHDDGYAKADRFGEDSQGTGVADSVGPLVDRVVGGRCDDDGIGLGE